MFDLYIDEDAMRISFVNILRSQGFDVLTAEEANQLSKDDLDQLTFATDQERVLFSHNIIDFKQIHEKQMKKGGNHAGILLAPQRKFSPLQQSRLIYLISRQLTYHKIKNNLLFVSNWAK